MTPPVHAAISRIVRDEWPRVMATLHRDLGDLDAAHDAAQDAVEIALTSWLDDGIPDRPGAWITIVARRRAVDRIRRERTGRDKSELLARLEARAAEIDPLEITDDSTLLRDEQLRLFFGCCHPALSVEAQMALTLRSLGGLTTTEIARGFLVPEATMAQRLVRAKRKIADATIPFRIPDDHELLSRMRVVHHVLYLVFNEGAYASSGDEALRSDLSGEAIRLARLLTELVADDPETLALLALFLFIDSRRDTRVAADGAIVLLADQDRTSWHRESIAKAGDLLDRAMRLGRPGPYQLEAAINALHAEATDATETDWPQIALLYERLAEHRPGPVVALNHAVAVAMAEGPHAGLELIDERGLPDELDQYHYLHAARADLLRRLADPRAKPAYERALSLATNDAERRFLLARLKEFD